MIGNLPAAERDRLKKEEEKAHQQGVKDFEKTIKEMETHLKDETDSNKAFATRAPEEKDAPFNSELKHMEKELESVASEFKKAGTAIDKDINKGRL